MDAWKCSNREYAAISTLYWVTGYLQASKGTVETQKILDYINKTLEEKTAELDAKYPDRKEEV